MNNARCSWEWKKRNEVHIVLLDGYMAPGYATGMWPSKSFFQSKYTIGITTRFGGFNLKDNAQNGSPLQVASTKMKQHLVTTTKRTQVHSKTCSLHFLQTWVSWWFRNPTNHLMYKTPQIMGYLPYQLVNAGFLNHQQFHQKTTGRNQQPATKSSLSKHLLHQLLAMSFGCHLDVGFPINRLNGISCIWQDW